MTALLYLFGAIVKNSHIVHSFRYLSLLSKIQLFSAVFLTIAALPLFLIAINQQTRQVQYAASFTCAQSGDVCMAPAVGKLCNLNDPTCVCDGGFSDCGVSTPLCCGANHRTYQPPAPPTANPQQSTCMSNGDVCVPAGIGGGCANGQQPLPYSCGGGAFYCCRPSVTYPGGQGGNQCGNCANQPCNSPGQYCEEPINPTNSFAVYLCNKFNGTWQFQYKQNWSKTCSWTAPSSGGGSSHLYGPDTCAVNAGTCVPGGTSCDAQSNPQLGPGNYYASTDTNIHCPTGSGQICCMQGGLSSSQAGFSISVNNLSPSSTLCSKQPDGTYSCSGIIVKAIGKGLTVNMSDTNGTAQFVPSSLNLVGAGSTDNVVLLNLTCPNNTTSAPDTLIFSDSQNKSAIQTITWTCANAPSSNGKKVTITPAPQPNTVTCVDNGPKGSSNGYVVKVGGVPLYSYCANYEYCQNNSNGTISCIGKSCQGSGGFCESQSQYINVCQNAGTGSCDTGGTCCADKKQPAPKIIQLKTITYLHCDGNGNEFLEMPNKILKAYCSNDYSCQNDRAGNAHCISNYCNAGGQSCVPDNSNFVEKSIVTSVTSLLGFSFYAGDSINPPINTTLIGQLIFIPASQITTNPPKVYTITVPFTYNPQTQTYDNHLVDSGPLPSDTYEIYLHVNKYLNVQLRNGGGSALFLINHGQTITLPTITLIPGDIAPNPKGDNFVDIIDYNRLLGCLGKQPKDTCLAADLNNDGAIDQKDVDILTKHFDQLGDSFQTPEFVCQPDISCNTGQSSLQMCTLQCTKQISY